VTRGSNYITPVLFVAMGLVLVYLFYVFSQNTAADALSRSGSDVFSAVSTVPVSIVYAVGDYNDTTGQAHVCVGVRAVSRSVELTGVTIVVKSTSGVVLHTVDGVTGSCSVLSEDNACRFCIDAPLRPGEYLVEFQCPRCITTSGHLIVR